MIKFYTFAVILCLRIAYQPGNQHSLTAFSTTAPAKLVSVKAEYHKDKVYLKWEVDENQTADQFTIEKSLDGRNFRTAALAFGSDEQGVYEYKFYEKVGNQKTRYRIKLINKDRRTEYSEVITIDPLRTQS